MNNTGIKIFFIAILGAVAVLLDPIIRQNTLIIDNNINMIFQYVTRMGDAIIGIPLVILILATAYYKHESLRKHILNGFFKTIITMFAGTVVINIGKSIIGRARPKLFIDYGAYHFKPFNFVWDYDYSSFPSGHTMTWGLLAFSMAFIFPRYQILWIFSAVLVGLSRVILGSHYTSDVFFSLLLSYSIVYYCHNYVSCPFLERLKKKFNL
jgi:membrane-associated phospholipid phosphatase